MKKEKEAPLYFDLNDKEFKRYKAFYNKKKREFRKNDPQERISFTFLFSPTGIGDQIIVRCNQDGEEKDITDYKSW